ncbi:fibronectin type III domain-containing protein [Aquimarina sp. 2201CG1-2-11]|uniref:InlB B-repeat-containing protein n=1 Tax=Aquimarina discodermiae TaxID=3231043 RepID=UPI0034628CFC
MKKLIVLIVILTGLHAYSSNDKYRLTLRGNPSTSMVVGWNQISGSNPTVYYGTTDFGTNYASYPNSKTPDRTVSYKGMTNTFARLTGLQPDTAYYFVIRDSQGTSQRFWFKTAPADNSRLSFIAGGDSRNNRTPRQNANRLVAKLKPHAILFGGDMTNGDSSREWQNWFNDWQLTIASDNRMFPIVAARGNHEDSNNSIYNLFDTPSSSVYYALTFGNNLIRAYTLNSEISISGSQTNWLQSDLNANSGVIWKMAQYHKPMRPHVSSKSEGNSEYSNWAQLFYDKGVKFVMECDSHTVKTTWPVRPSTGSGSDEGFVRDDQNGTVYAGEGCWGAPLRSNNDSKNWTRNSGRFNQFKWIFIDENKIEIRTIRVDNASQVSSVSNNNVFQIPSGIDIWNPSNGSVVTINNTNVVDNQAPTIPANLVASNPTASTVSLNWNASSDNIGVTGYDIYRVNTNSIVASVTGTSYTATGLSPNTSYSFRVRAKDAAGNTSGYGNTASATTLDGSAQLYTLGITTVGTSNATHSTRRAMPYTINENGTLQSLAVHIEGGSGSVQLGVYADNNGVPGNRLGQTPITAIRSTRGWQTISLQSPVTVANGAQVWLAWIFSNNPGIAYVSGSPGRYQATGSSWSSSGNNMPSSYGSGSQSNYRYSIYANYTRSTTSTTYTLTTNTTGQGSVSGGGIYNSGSTATVTASPASGWKFDSWSGSLSGTNSPNTIVMNANKSVTANFSEITGGQTGRVEVAITSGSDDVEESQNGAIYSNSSDLEMVYDSYNSNGYQTIGLRFRSVTIPKNATITNAYIQFNADESNSASASLEISLHNDSNSPAFSGTNNVSSRTTFSNKVIWSPGAWSSNQNGSAQRTPDLKAMVQSLVNLGSWSSGNNAGFIIRGTGNSLTSTSAKRVADSYEGGASKAAKLIVEYVTSSSKSERISTIKNQQLVVFPNPFTRDVTIDTSWLREGEGYTVVMYNVNGTVVFSKNIVAIKDKVLTIHPEVKHSGIYFLSINDQNDNSLYTQRLIRK